METIDMILILGFNVVAVYIFIIITWIKIAKLKEELHKSNQK